MAAAFAFLGIWLISLVVALLAALQLGDFFGANNEFSLVILGVMGFTVFALLVFALAYAMARRAAVFAFVALALAAIALTPAALPGLIQTIADRSTNPYTVGIENTAIKLELVIPALAAVLVQWGLVRRRWLRAAAEDDFTRWPWIATAVAGLVVLNPFGLAFLQSLAATLGGGFDVAIHGDGNGSRPCRAARDGVDRMLYQRPHFAPPFGRTYSVIARAGAN